MLRRRETSLWDIVSASSTIDPEDLLEAVRAESGVSSHDARTRLLLRDSLAALRDAMGHARLSHALGDDVVGRLDKALRDVPDEFGFPSIKERLMPSTRLETVEQFLRELGTSIRTPARIDVGGSVALIFAGLFDRHTEDIDVVDEIPIEFRGEHDLLNALAARYALRLTHFQSHYLPEGWQFRLVNRGRYGELEVHTVDPLDIFVGKLFSARAKDRDDLRALKGFFTKGQILERWNASTHRLVQEKELRANAAKNWYVVFGTSPL